MKNKTRTALAQKGQNSDVIYSRPSTAIGEHSECTQFSMLKQCIISSYPLYKILKRRRRVGLRGNLENKPASVENLRTKFKADVEIKRTKDVVKTTRILGTHGQHAHAAKRRQAARNAVCLAAKPLHRGAQVEISRTKADVETSLRGKLENEI